MSTFASAFYIGSVLYPQD